MHQVSDEEVIKAHHGTKLSVDIVGYLGKTSNMFQFVDIFSIPEITLLRDVTQVCQKQTGHFLSSFCSFSISILLIVVFHSLRNMSIMMSE